MAPGAVANPLTSDPSAMAYAQTGGPAAGGGGSDTANPTPGELNPSLTPGAGTTPTGAGPGGSYDPTKTTPYSPEYAAQFQAPIANNLPPQEPIQNLGAVSHTGAMAYLGDNILRGYMQGKAVRDMRNAVNTQRQSSALGNLAENAASQYYDYTQLHGADPNDPQLQNLKANVDATHNAQLDFMKNHINGLQVDKKTGELKPSSWWQKLTSNNPNDIAPAVYEGVKQMGPAVYHQTQQFATPEYIAQAKARGQAAQAVQQTGVTAAQTAQVQSQTAQQLAGYQQRLQQLRATPPEQMTPQLEEERDRLQNLVINSNPAAKFQPIAGQKPYQHDGAGAYFMAFRGPNGQVMERQMPPDFKPTLTSTQIPLEVVAYDEQGKPMWTGVSKVTGEELPNMRNYTRAIPPSYLGKLTKGSYVTSDNAGNVTSHSVTSWAGPPGQVGQTAPGSAGLNEPGTPPPTAPNGATPNAAQTKAGVAPAGTPNPNSPAHGQAAAPPHQTPAATNFRNPNSPAAYTPPANVAEANKLDPKDPDWQPNPANPEEVWAKRVYDGGETNQEVKVPSQPKYLANAVASFMATHGMQPGNVDTTAERTSYHAMRDAYPSINKTIGLLEQAMGITSNMTDQQKRAIINQNNGLGAAFDQRMSALMYKNGVSPGDLKNQINQNVALDALSGTAPWTKVGRNVQVFNKIQQHLPNMETDSIGQMYDKLTGMRGIFDETLGAYNSRHHASGSKPQQQNTAQPAPAAAAAPAPPPTPQTHVFNVAAWQAANPKGDVNAARAAATAQHYTIVEK